jgi:hypothetical protein
MVYSVSPCVAKGRRINARAWTGDISDTISTLASKTEENYEKKVSQDLNSAPPEYEAAMPLQRQHSVVTNRI